MKASLSFLLLSIAANVAVGGDVKSAEFTVDLQKASSGFDGESCWVHARAAIVPGSHNRTSDGPVAVMTTQKLKLSGSDVFYALHQLTSSDAGVTWTAPGYLPEFARQTFRGDPEDATGADIAPELLQKKDETTVCDFVPKWHAKTGRILGIGHTVWYRDNKVMHKRPRGIAYSVSDPASDSPPWAPWSKWECVKLPDEPRFKCAGSGSQQRWDLPNGDILLPVYLNAPGAPQYASIVIRCRFDGTTLTYVEHGNDLSIPVKRGLYEPSLTKFGNEFFLTLRNDDHGYVARSKDGLQFAEPTMWRFDDGEELGNYNTQQHWISNRHGLYLVYTRKGANNDHVFRHRAPLFIARVDPVKLRVIRETERVLVPERGARLGIFGITDVSPDEAWVTVTEWMQPKGVEKHGSDNTIWVARIHWQP